MNCNVAIYSSHGIAIYIYIFVTWNCNIYIYVYIYIYIRAIKCQGCEKMYIGETNNLRLRTNVHRDHASKIWALVSVDTFKNARNLNPPTKILKM